MSSVDLTVRRRPLSYCGQLDSRATGDIDTVVIHCTELPDLAMAREYAETIRYPGSGTGNSGHLYVDRDGRVEEWVPLDRVAHHVRNRNVHTVGIELVNLGRYPDWFHSTGQEMTEPYPPVQIDALVGLLHRLVRELPSLRWITGHEQLDTGQVPATDDPAVTVFRKRDPGPLFPWTRVLSDVPRLLPEETNGR
jgi:N-acetylmuramoyl-L-alanine amidase